MTTKRHKHEIELNAKDRTARATKTAERNFANLGAKAKKHFATVANFAKKASAAVGAIGAATIYASRQAVSEADRIAKQSRRLRIDPALYQSVSVYAADAGADVAGVLKAFEKFEVTAGEAAQGMATYRDAYEQLGVATHHANGRMKTGVELADEIAKVFANASDKTALFSSLQRLAGRSARELSLILKDGAGGIKAYHDAAVSAGATIDRETLKNAEALESKMGKVAAQFKAHWTTSLVGVARNFDGLINFAGRTLGLWASDSADQMAEIFDPLFISFDRLINQWRQASFGQEFETNEKLIARSVVAVEKWRTELNAAAEGTRRRTFAAEQLARQEARLNKLIAERARLTEAYNTALDGTIARENAAHDQRLKNERERLKIDSFFQDSENVQDYNETPLIDSARETQSTLTDAQAAGESKRLKLAQSYNAQIQKIASAAQKKQQGIAYASALTNTALSMSSGYTQGMAQGGLPLAVAYMLAAAVTGAKLLGDISSNSNPTGGAAAPAPAPPTNRTTVTQNVNFFGRLDGAENTAKEISEALRASVPDYNRA